jgi:hypothetical protein
LVIQLRLRLCSRRPLSPIQRNQPTLLKLSEREEGAGGVAGAGDIEAGIGGEVGVIVAGATGVGATDVVGDTGEDGPIDPIGASTADGLITATATVMAMVAHGDIGGPTAGDVCLIGAGMADRSFRSGSALARGSNDRVRPLRRRRTFRIVGAHHQLVGQLSCRLIPRATTLCQANAKSARSSPPALTGTRRKLQDMLFWVLDFPDCAGSRVASRS